MKSLDAAIEDLEGQTYGYITAGIQALERELGSEPGWLLNECFEALEREYDAKEEARKEAIRQRNEAIRLREGK